jgi:hypothetical protein
MNNFLKKQILAFELHKNQTYVDRLLKEGEIQGYKKILDVYSGLLDNEDIKKSYNTIKKLLDKSIEELNYLKGSEYVFNKLNEDIENNLTSLDILEKIKFKKEYSKDIQVRIDNGKCALKRPGGKKKFMCDDEVVKGTKYCKEHLKKYEPIKYTEIFPKD